MTKRQAKIKSTIEYLKKYVNTYETQYGYLDYSNDIIINDMLYGIGIAINEQKYKYANGYREFKKYLLKKFLQNT